MEREQKAQLELVSRMVETGRLLEVLRQAREVVGVVGGLCREVEVPTGEGNTYIRLDALSADLREVEEVLSMRGWREGVE